MAKRNTWIILVVAAVVGMLALRLGMPSGSRVQHRQVSTTDETIAPRVTPEPSPIERPLIPAAIQLAPAPAEPEADAPPATQPATVGEHAKPRPAKLFADVQIPDKELTPSQQIARIALSFVGMDNDAEDIWMAVIDDPTMPAEDRKNLIEDLNEDGFADPDHPTADELPLIVNRLALIESIAPDAIDDVNLAAFAEAHKDLLEMYRRLTQ